MPTSPTASDPQDDAADDALARCVGDPARFLAEHWARAPLYRPAADATAFADLFSLADVDRIISSTTPRFPAFRLVKEGRQLDPRSYTRSGRVGGQPVDDLADPGSVYELFGGGATIVLQSLHRFWPPLVRLSRDLELALTHPVQVNAYVTPPASRGLGVHHDEHDVFVLQVHGRKRWDVYDPAGGPEDRLVVAELAPGDCLYLPQRFPHAAWTAATASVHLTVGVVPVTWAEAVRRAVVPALEDALSGEPLPAGFAADPDALVAGVAEQLGEVRRRLDKLDPAAIAVAAADRFWSGRPPVLSGQLQHLLALEEIADHTVVRRRPGAVCRLRRRGDRLEVLLGDRALRMPARLAPAVRAILAGDRLVVGDLAGHLDPPSRLVLVRRLVREGLLEPAAPPEGGTTHGSAAGAPSRSG
jgi:bifunctional lysine-specific demethylase and histidyl-hydroxylase NO66